MRECGYAIFMSDGDDGARLEAEGATMEGVNRLYDVRLRSLPWWRQLQIPVISATVGGAIRLIGPTLRFETVGMQHYHQARAQGQAVVAAFWHQCIFAAAWYWRRRGVVVMTTANFDGQWIGKVIESLGFGVAQGSSSRGGLRGLAAMEKALADGCDAAFTVDGPRGPRFVAKPGPVMLARRTGHPIFAFHIALQRKHSLAKTWDRTQIPSPFSGAVLVAEPLIPVSTQASAEEMKRKQDEMQAALEKAQGLAESWFSRSEAERARLRDQV